MKYTLYLAQLQGAPENADLVNSGIHSEAMIERVGKSTLRPQLSKFGDALEAVIERVWRCTWRLQLSKFGDALEATIERVWRCSWKP